jgi:hypothetical protein
MGSFVNYCSCEGEHVSCEVCQTECGCTCDESYESWKDGMLID